jgi:thiol:disulfide interchange protein DsbC
MNITQAYADNVMSIEQKQVNLITQTLKTKFPDLKLDSVTISEIPNIYQVIAGHHVIYIDATASYLVLGNIISLKDNTNLTAQKINDLSTINWKTLDKSSAIIQYPVSGKSDYSIAVFLNPDCPFCAKYLAETLMKLDNVTIYYYLIPLKTHPDSDLHIKQIMCSVDPQKAMEKYMLDNIPLTASSSCSSVKNVNKNLEIAKNLIDLQGTPTTVLSNGKILPGMLELNYLKGQMK